MLWPEGGAEELRWKSQQKVSAPAMRQLRMLEHSKRIRPRFPRSIVSNDNVRTQSWKLDNTVVDSVGTNVCVHVHDRHRWSVDTVKDDSGP